MINKYYKKNKEWYQNSCDKKKKKKGKKNPETDIKIFLRKKKERKLST